MRQLTGADEMWFSLEATNTPMHITDVHIYDPSTAPGGKVTREQIVDFIKPRLDQLFMRERRVPVPFGLDYSYWAEDPVFDFNHHIRSITLPAPGNWRQFCETVEAIIEKPLDLNRPLWEMHIIDGLSDIEGFPKGCFAIVHKKHHGQFDGSSATYLKSTLHTLEPDAKVEAPQAKKAQTPERIPSQIELAYRTYWQSMVRPMVVSSFFFRTLPTLPKALQAVSKDSENMMKRARTRFSGTIPSPRRIIDGKAYPFDEIQKFRKYVPGATINDVVLTIYSGALRRYLQQHGELPTEQLKALTPISVRKEEEKDIGGNKVFSMTPNMHVEVGDPVERMKKVHDAAKHSKDFTAAIGGRAMCEMLEIAPLTLIDSAIKATVGVKAADFVTAVHSGVGVSNVPGSRVPLYFCGAKQLQCYSWGFLMDGMGLLLVASSYASDITFTVVSCPEMMPDSDFFMKCMEESYNELKSMLEPSSEPVAEKTQETTGAPAKKAAKGSARQS